MLHAHSGFPISVPLNVWGSLSHCEISEDTIFVRALNSWSILRPLKKMLSYLLLSGHVFGLWDCKLQRNLNSLRCGTILKFKANDAPVHHWPWIWQISRCKDFHRIEHLKRRVQKNTINCISCIYVCKSYENLCSIRLDRENLSKLLRLPASNKYLGLKQNLSLRDQELFKNLKGRPKLWFCPLVNAWVQRP